MSLNIPTIEDVIDITRRASLNAGGSILGITASTPKYVAVPEESDPNAVNEFVVDVYLLEGTSQIVNVASSSNGLRRIDNVLIASEASGSLLANLHTPVEIMLRGPGQLTVVGRSMVALPYVDLDEYDLGALKIVHTAELEYDSEADVWRDAFGLVCNINTGGTNISAEVIFAYTSTTDTGQSTLADLIFTDPGVIGGTQVELGVNPLSRIIIIVTFIYSGTATEYLGISEEVSEELS